MTNIPVVQSPNLALDCFDQLDQLERLADHARHDSTTRWALRLQEVADLPESIRSLLPLVRALGSVDRHGDETVHPNRIGDFEILGLLGSGGMGTVYHARQPSLDRPVAIKVCRADVSKDPKLIERFHREAKLIGRLSHDNIVDVYDSGIADGLAFFAMHYIDGKSLNHFVGHPCEATTNPATTIPATTIVDWIIQACRAVAHAHDLGVIHRDIKPSNLMVDRRGKLWVLDFGIARMVDHDDETRAEGLAGTLRYVSPERFDGDDANQRSDIYSLGAVAFELLTGNPLVSGEGPVDVIQQIRFPKLAVRDRLAAHVPDTLADVIADAVAIDPSVRPATALVFADQLREALGDVGCSEIHTVSRRDISPTAFGARFRWTALAAAVLLAFVGSISIWSHGFANSPKPNLLVEESEAASAGVPVISTIVVNTVEDVVSERDGLISLREALLAANVSESDDRIIFDIPGSPPFRLAPTVPLPVLAADGIVIDGQSDRDPTKPRRVELSGRRFSVSAAMLDIRGRKVKISGLAIVDGTGVGVMLRSGSDGSQIRDNHIGVRVSDRGTTPAGNQYQGIFLQSNANTIDHNVISGNGANGIWIRGDGDTAEGQGNWLTNNRIGTDGAGRCGMGNRIHGVVLSHRARDNHLVGNLISGNGCIGIFLDEAGTNDNVVEANQVGLDINGRATIGNATWGVVIGNASGNRIGKTPGGQSQGNRVAGNGIGGIAVIGANARDNLVAGNVVQTNGRSSLPIDAPSISLYAGAGDDFDIFASQNDGSPQATKFVDNVPWR